MVLDGNIIINVQRLVRRVDTTQERKTQVSLKMVLIVKIMNI